MEPIKRSEVDALEMYSQIACTVLKHLETLRFNVNRKQDQNAYASMRNMIDYANDNWQAIYDLFYVFREIAAGHPVRKR